MNEVQNAVAGAAWRRLIRRTLHASLLASTILVLAAGCIELQEAIQFVLSGTLPGGVAPPPHENDDLPDGGNGEEELPFVSLTASNPTPQLSEQVTLSCSVTRGDTDGVTFAFNPVDALISVNPIAGIATFIVNETALGVSMGFSCTATNDAGTGPPSNTVVITAGGA